MEITCSAVAMLPQLSVAVKVLVIVLFNGQSGSIVSTSSTVTSTLLSQLSVAVTFAALGIVSLQLTTMFAGISPRTGSVVSLTTTVC